MITSAAHVPRGALRPVPVKAKVSEEELARINNEMLQELQGTKDNEAEGSASDDGEMQGVESEDEIATAQRAASNVRSSTMDLPAVGSSMRLIGREAESEEQMQKLLEELDLDNYETDSDEENVLERAMGPSALKSGLIYAGDDPYLKEGSGASDTEEDWKYNPEDVLFVATKSKDDMGTLEVWVYEEADDTSGGNLFVHHDLVLPSFPLSLSLMDVCPGEGGDKKVSTVAVGSMAAGIEIWDLDVADAVEPLACLFDEPSSSRKYGGKKDATVALAWNSQFRNVLASGGGDKRVRVWDVVKEKRKHKLKIHSKEVQCVVWNPQEASVMATASFDETACLLDVRTPDGEPLRWTLSGQAEALAWSPSSPTSFLTSTEDGMVACFDARKGSGSDSIFRLAAHEKPTTVIGFCPSAQNLLMSGSIDKKVKVWNTSGGTPSLLVEKDLGAGAIFTGGFCGNSAPHLIYVGGDHGEIVVWDTRASAAVARQLGQTTSLPQIFVQGNQEE